jgi:hypothetical protein
MEQVRFGYDRPSPIEIDDSPVLIPLLEMSQRQTGKLPASVM